MPTEEAPDAAFQAKYEEFAADLLDSFPEMAPQIRGALAIPVAERVATYKTAVFPTARSASARKPDVCPGALLPGVIMPDNIWETTGSRTKKAILEYLSLLNLSVAFLSMGEGDGAGEGAAEFTKDWAEQMMRDARASMSKIDFDNLSKTFFKAFGSDGGALPPLPEKFLKGRLARLAEDMVKEFRPEDFGLKPEDIEACERDPTRAFEILMKTSMSNPAMIQGAIGRVAKKLQDKVARGELKPQELVAEAEELIKEFQTHPAFVELMKSFKDAFNVDEDMDLARASGRDGEGRLAAARARLRKKLDAKKGAKK